MKNEQHYVDIAVKAAKRAALKLSAEARKENRPLPIWKNGRVEFEVPTYTQKNAQVDS